MREGCRSQAGRRGKTSSTVNGSADAFVRGSVAGSSPWLQEVIVTPNHPLYGPTHRHFDADGVELKLCVWADTETGEVAVAVRDSDGRQE